MASSRKMPSERAMQAGLYGRYQGFDPQTFDAAFRLLQAGKVEVVSRSRDGHSVYGQVQGRSRKPAQTLVNNIDRDEPFAGDCSCGKAFCVHLCALALFVDVQQPVPDQPDAGEGQTAPVAETAGIEAIMDQRRLVFFLVPGPDGIAGQLLPHVELYEAELDQRHYFRYQPEYAGLLPTFTGELEQGWLARLEACDRHPDAGCTQLLSELLSAGRCHLLSGAPRLELAPARTIGYRWLLLADGTQELDWLLAETERLFFFAGLWYLDTAAGCCGPVETGLSPELLQLFVRHNRILPQQLAKVRQSMLARKPGPEVVLPRALEYQRIKGGKPEPLLWIGPSQSGQDSQFQAGLECRLLFRYQGRLLPDTRSNSVLDGTRVLNLERNQKAEAVCLEMLEPLFAINPRNPYERHIEPEFWQLHGPAFLQNLIGLGWKVQQDRSMQGRIRFVDGWQLEMRGDAESLRLFCWCLHKGQQTDILPLLRESQLSRSVLFESWQLSQFPPGQLLTLPDGQGQLLSLAAGLAHILIDSLFELQSPARDSEAGLPLSAARAASLYLLLKDTFGEQLGWQIPESIEQLSQALQLREQASAEMPATLECSLRPYQEQGLAWLQLLSRHGLGGILADDMGLGKTLQCLAWLLSRQPLGAGPALVVAPKSLLGNWRAEARRFAPSLKVLVLDGPDRQKYFAQLSWYDLVITSYPLLCRDQESLASLTFDALILDEAQWVKNPTSQTARAVRGIKAGNRLCLTGTPLENHLGELWALFDFLMPGFLGGPNLFQKLVRDPIEKWQDAEANQRLAKRIGPFLLRRTKAQVLPELPPKTEIARYLDMDEGQQRLYEGIRSLIYPELKEKLAQQGLKRSSISILDALLKLRQVCCDPRLLKGLELEQEAMQTSSIKLEYLRDLLPELVAEGRRILLFSQFTSMLELIEQELTALQIPWLKLTGKSQRRDLLVDKFQRGEVPLFLISLKAGGVGLNLTAADTLIHFDPWWNPAVERQATDRAHRLGQDKPVFVYKLFCAGSVESRIQELQARKQALADNLLSASEGLATSWTEQDLEYLFAPLDRA